MREIKFRAWDEKKKKMFRVACIDWDQFLILDEDLQAFKMNLTPLMQHTGLKDKNGKEIYEGDIVKDERRQSDHCIGGKQVVKFEDGAFLPFAVPLWEGTMDVEGCEIIGNVWENPELLKQI